MKKNNTFIYGDSGFIGSHLKKYLSSKQKINLASTKFKLKKKINSENYYTDFWSKIISNSDTIVYLSFNNDLENLKKNLSKSFYQNLVPLITLNEVIKKKQKKIKIIYSSTASLYGNNVKLPANENSKIEINNIYEFLKHTSEQVLINSNNKYLNYQIIRLSNVYGKNISKLKQNNRQVLTKVINNAYLDKKISVFGTGNYFRDFIHVSDVCNAIYKIITKNNLNNEIFNIASGKKIKLIDIFKNIRSIIFKNYNFLIKIEKIKLKNINFDVSDIRNFQASISKSSKKFSWHPKITLNHGLNNLVNYVFSEKNKKY